MEKITYLPFAIDKINSLVDVLFDTKYFAIKENAYAYVDAIYDFIETISPITPLTHQEQKVWRLVLRIQAQQANKLVRYLRQTRESIHCQKPD